ncbi:MAG TPA: hypothetical protein GXX29_15485 [Firmicutes bacterium]|nr:hypothetical protein [Bacillota bacterium]
MADGTTNKGTLFWLAYPTTITDITERDALIIILADIDDTEFEVAIPGLGFSVMGTVSPGTPALVTIPMAAEISSNELIEKKGIRVTATHPVTVIFSATSPPQTSNDAYLALPVASLGTQLHMVMGYQEDLSVRGFDPEFAPSQVTIVGTEDDTNVTVIPSCVSLMGSPIGVPINFVLNEGEIWQYACGNLGDVTGTVITANKPVTVIGGSRCSDVPPNTAACDYLVEQLVSEVYWGTDYLIPPINNDTSNLIRILAGQDNTEVIIDDGTLPVVVNLDAGQKFDQFYSVPVQITSNKPIYVGQYGAGLERTPINQNRDPFFVQIIPTNRFLKEFRFYSLSGYFLSFINIVAPTGTNVALDGVPVVGFSPMPGGTHIWNTLQVDAGEHVVTADQPAMVYVYGFRIRSGYGYPAGLLISPPRRPSRGLQLT